jgi:hypothetical protein
MGSPTSLAREAVVRASEDQETELHAVEPLTTAFEHSGDS